MASTGASAVLTSQPKGGLLNLIKNTLIPASRLNNNFNALKKNENNKGRFLNKLREQRIVTGQEEINIPIIIVVALIVNFLLIELIPFIYVKSFGCVDYLSGFTNETTSWNKFVLRIIGLGISLTFATYMYSGDLDFEKSMIVYSIVGIVIFLFLMVFGWAPEKFLIFKVDSLSNTCKNLKPKFIS